MFAEGNEHCIKDSFLLLAGKPTGQNQEGHGSETHIAGQLVIVVSSDDDFFFCFVGDARSPVERILANALHIDSPFVLVVQLLT